MSTEAAIERRGTQHVLDRGGWEVKMHQDGVGRRGIPDRIYCYRGLFLAVEWKAPGASTQPGRDAHQRHELLAIRKAGGLAFRFSAADELLMVLQSIDDILVDVGGTGADRPEDIAEELNRRQPIEPRIVHL